MHNLNLHLLRTSAGSTRRPTFLRPLATSIRQPWLLSRRSPRLIPVRTYAVKPSAEPEGGADTPAPDRVKEEQAQSKSPFYFEAGYALFAKRASRPFPPPFLSMPSSSFSDPLSTHNRSRDKRPQLEFEGEMIRGVTNGDDAVLVGPRLIAANDGVGAWAQKERGHAALWSRLILHFWALEAERDQFGASSSPNPKAYLQRAFEHTKNATSEPNEWLGTTTVSCALIHSAGNSDAPTPMLYVTQLGDSQILVVRPSDKSVVFQTKEQWHWFDCPRQLGTNSPDTPDGEAVMDEVAIEEGDVVLAMSDGVIDNLWQHEIVTNVVESVEAQEEKGSLKIEASADELKKGMQYVAAELVKAARTIAQDPFAESPFMERAIEEGLTIEGGKLDDISVVAALCVRRKT